MTPVDPISDKACPTMDCIRFQDGFKYQLVQDAVYQTRIVPPHDIDTRFVSLSSSGLLTLKAGFAWNGVSGPTIQRNSNRRGGAFHDGLYRLMRFGLIDFLPLDLAREAADELLQEIWIKDGMYVWLAKLEVKMVRRFGLGSARPSGEPEVMTSP